MRFVDQNEYRIVEPIYLLTLLQKFDHSGDTENVCRVCKLCAEGKISFHKLTQTLLTSAECPTNICRGEVSLTSQSLQVLSTEPVR